jgi:hypothetical protein
VGVGVKIHSAGVKPLCHCARPFLFVISIVFNLMFQLHARFDEMKISVSEEKKQVEEQRRLVEDQIADFQRRKSQFEA